MWDLMAVLPPQASTIAGSVDLLFTALSVVTVFFSVLIAGAIVVMAFRYRRGRAVDRSNPPRYHLPIEIVWTAVPLGIVLVLFVWASLLYFRNSRVPAGAMDIYVVGKQWMWKIQHPEGRWENDELHIPVGRPIKLTMTSEDVIHSFFIPAFRVKQDVLPGRYTQMWFQATRVGTYHLFCAEYCGTNHSGMVGTVTVMEPADYERWLRTGSFQGSLAAAGERLFRRHGCSGCHSENSSVHAPLLDGIYGTQVAVQIPRGGQPLATVPATTVTADDRYIHDSIVLPEKEIAAGFQPIMPTFRNQLTEEEILQLVAYIKSLSRADTRSRRERGTRGGPLSPEEYRARTGFTPPRVPGGAAGAASGRTPAPTGATGTPRQSGVMGSRALPPNTSGIPGPPVSPPAPSRAGAPPQADSGTNER